LKKTSIGGQGVLEGVMMRAPKKSALAVRKENGELTLDEWKNKERNEWYAKVPIIRGVVNFVDMMVMGYSTITKSAKMFDESLSAEFEPSKFEKKIAEKTGKNAMDVMIVFAAFLGILLAVGLFFILPTLITDLIKGSLENQTLINLIEGGVRIVIMMIYMLAVRLMKDIARVFGYHGAEHKTINCFEKDLPLTVENVRKCSRLHPRCGTSYILIVMVVSVLVYAVTGFSGHGILRVLVKLALLPLIAGISYEFLKFAAKSDNLCFRILRWPGMQLQRLTTLEPDDGMIECAILAFEAALEEKSAEEIEEMRKSFDRRVNKPEETTEEAEISAENPAEETANETEESCVTNEQA